MFTFTPMTEEEIDSFSLIEEGIYDFSVVKSTKKISKSNNPMAELIIDVWDKEGKVHTVFDYLVFSNIPLNIRKIKHFCEAVGILEDYKKGQIPESLESLSGKASISIQEGQEIPHDKLNGKAPGSKYSAKNVVLDYLKKEIKMDDFVDDESIPF